MDIVRWTEDLATGDPRVDREHREIFARLGAYQESLQNGGGDADNLFRFLLRYVVTHFSAEERLMENVGYPGLAAHRAQHMRLLEDVRSLPHGDPGRFVPSKAQAGDLFLPWFLDHIARFDHAFAAWRRARAVPPPSSRPRRNSIDPA